MNVLATDKRAQIIGCLAEGVSMRATCRLTGAAKKTVERLLVSAGNACREYQDKVMRDLPCKKLENHKHAVAIHFMHYNFVRIHQTLRVTPAMEAGVSDHVWSLEEIVALLD